MTVRLAAAIPANSTEQLALEGNRVQPIKMTATLHELFDFLQARCGHVVESLKLQCRDAESAASVLAGCLWVDAADGISDMSTIVLLTETAAQTIQQDCDSMAAGQCPAWLDPDHLQQICVAVCGRLWSRRSDVAWANLAGPEICSRIAACSEQLLLCINALLLTLASADSSSLRSTALLCLRAWLPAMLQTVQETTSAANRSDVPPHMRAFRWVNLVWKQIHLVGTNLHSDLKPEVPELGHTIPVAVQLAMVSCAQFTVCMRACMLTTWLRFNHGAVS